MEIAEFLLARFAEEEAVAMAATPGPWKWAGDREEDGAFLDGSGRDERGYPPSVLSAYGMHTEGFLVVSAEDAEHIARWDPARVLAECEADRRIVGWFQTVGTMTDRDSLEIRHNELLHVLSALALPYADHPDYNPEWKP